MAKTQNHWTMKLEMIWRVYFSAHIELRWLASSMGCLYPELWRFQLEGATKHPCTCLRLYNVCHVSYW